MATNNAWNNVITASGGNISFNGGLATNSSGISVNTVQPAFFAYLSTTVSNVTGSGGAYTIVFNSTRFNQGSVYNTANGVFTAPIAGRYIIGCSINSNTFGASNTAQFCKINTTVDHFLFGLLNPRATFATINQGVFGDCVLANMNANDTATVIYQVNGSSATVNISGSSSLSGEIGTYFYAYLVC